jgi:hypothetical protein
MTPTAFHTPEASAQSAAVWQPALPGAPPSAALAPVLESRALASTPASVTAGAQYWIGGGCDNAPSKVELEQKNVASETVYVTPHTFGNVLPTPYPVANSSPTSGLALPFFMQVQNVP